MTPNEYRPKTARSSSTRFASLVSLFARDIPELFAVGGVVIEDFLDEDIDEFVMTPDKYTPRAIGAFIIALAKVFSETSLPLQQQVTASSLLADLERQLESSIQNLPMLTLEALRLRQECGSDSRVDISTNN